MAYKCSRCGCEEQHSGTFLSPAYGMVLHTANLQFVPDKDQRKFFGLEGKGVAVTATMCKECGLLELTGDRSKLRRVAGA